MCPNFQAKWKTLTVLAKISPNMNLVFEMQENNVGIRISILEMSCVPIFESK